MLIRRGVRIRIRIRFRIENWIGVRVRVASGWELIIPSGCRLGLRLE